MAGFVKNAKKKNIKINGFPVRCQAAAFSKTLWNCIVDVESELDESEVEETGRKSSSAEG